MNVIGSGSFYKVGGGLATDDQLLMHSGIAIPGPTRALARASTYLALESKTNKNHVIIY